MIRFINTKRVYCYRTVSLKAVLICLNNPDITVTKISCSFYKLTCNWQYFSKHYNRWEFVPAMTGISEEECLLKFGDFIGGTKIRTGIWLWSKKLDLTDIIVDAQKYMKLKNKEENNGIS